MPLIMTQRIIEIKLIERTLLIIVILCITHDRLLQATNLIYNCKNNYVMGRAEWRSTLTRIPSSTSVGAPFSIEPDHRQWLEGIVVGLWWSCEGLGWHMQYRILRYTAKAFYTFVMFIGDYYTWQRHLVPLSYSLELYISLSEHLKRFSRICWHAYM